MIAVWESDISDTFLIPRLNCPIEMYLPLLFEVIGRVLFVFTLTPAAPLYLLCCYWSVSNTCTICRLLHIIHARGSYYTVDTYSGSFPSSSPHFRTYYVFLHSFEVGRRDTSCDYSRRLLASNNEVFYVFIVLPFGLSLAPYIFTRHLKPLEKHWRI